MYGRLVLVTEGAVIGVPVIILTLTLQDILRPLSGTTISATDCITGYYGMAKTVQVLAAPLILLPGSMSLCPLQLQTTLKLGFA